MNNSLQNRSLSKDEMRAAYCNALIDLAKVNDKIVVVDCDLAHSMGTLHFAETFAKREFNCGIQEANGCGVSAGLSAAGMIPFFHTFASFASRRVCDQAFISCAYAGLNVKIIGGDAGVTAATNGVTHMAFEDMGIMRSIPEVRVIEPTDTVMIRAILPQIVDHYGVDYIRMARKKVYTVYSKDADFTIGSANICREGSDITIIANGIMVHEALTAAEKLEQMDGIQARVVDMFTLKPIDAECIIASAKKTGAIVTAENHSVHNGLASAVAEVVVQNYPVPMGFVGVDDLFGEVGSQKELMQRFSLTSDAIYEKALHVLRRK